MIELMIELAAELSDHQARKWVQATASRWVLRADYETVGKWIWILAPTPSKTGH